MKVLPVIGACLIASVIFANEDNDATPSTRVPSASPQAPELSPEVVRQILDKKTSQLHQLQKDILELGGSISDPTRVKVIVRVIEINGVKLKSLNLSTPFLADNPATVSSRLVKSTVNVKSGVPFFLGGLSTSDTTLYCAVTAEILPDAQ